MKKIYMYISALLGSLLLISPVQAKMHNYTNTDFAMDTFVSQSIFSEGDDITGDILQTLRDTETDKISWTNPNSEVSKINQSAGDPKGVEVSEETASYLAATLVLAKDSDGAFDPTLGNVIRLWDIGGENPQIPDEQVLSGMMEHVNYQDVQIDGNTVFLKEGCSLDLGAVGKGIGCDLSRKILDQDNGIAGAIVNLGGSSVLSYGHKTDGTPWKVGITDPRNPEGDYMGIVKLDGTRFLSTSGDYEKYFMQDGVRYHHILDPRTGYPVQNGIASVTIICNNGLFADGLSTACFVLGPKAAQPLLEKYDAQALFIDGAHRIFMTDGMKECFVLAEEQYEIHEIQEWS